MQRQWGQPLLAGVSRRRFIRDGVVDVFARREKEKKNRKILWRWGAHLEAELFGVWGAPSGHHHLVHHDRFLCSGALVSQLELTAGQFLDADRVGARVAVHLPLKVLCHHCTALLIKLCVTRGRCYASR